MLVMSLPPPPASRVEKLVESLEDRVQELERKMLVMSSNSEQLEPLPKQLDNLELMLKTLSTHVEQSGMWEKRFVELENRFVEVERKIHVAELASIPLTKQTLERIHLLERRLRLDTQMSTASNTYTVGL